MKEIPEPLATAFIILMIACLAIFALIITLADTSK